MKFVYYYLMAILLGSGAFSVVSLMADDKTLAIAGLAIFVAVSFYGLWLITKKESSEPKQFRFRFKPIRSNIVIPCIGAVVVSVVALALGIESVAGIGAGILGTAVGSLIKLEETIITLESNVDN